MFPKLRVSKNVEDKTGRGVHDFPSKLFWFTVLKLSLREPFDAVLQKISGSEKFLTKR